MCGLGDASFATVGRPAIGAGRFGWCANFLCTRTPAEGKNIHDDGVSNYPELDVWGHTVAAGRELHVLVWEWGSHLYIA